MYVPRHFAETRVEVLHELIRRHPLGTLVVAAPDGLEASHVPFEISPEPAPFGTLRCHVAIMRFSFRDDLRRGVECSCAKTAGTCRELLAGETHLWTFVRV